jgi:hypothetical protein
VPDYSKGIGHAINNISNGAFTHPTLHVPISNPTTLFHRATNVLHATCGPNMFFWRLVYLKAFTEMLATFKNYTDDWEAEKKPNMARR